MQASPTPLPRQASRPCHRCETCPAIKMRVSSAAHAVGFNMAFCDGSVKVVNYSVDTTTHRYLGSRNDGVPIDGKKL